MIATDHFLSKVDRTETCWLWRGGLNPKGYGAFWIGKKNVAAHRWAYEHFVGPIPDGLQIDHLCRVRHCVNPAHLEAVTPLENSRRGIAGAVNGARQRAKTHCRYGHEYTEENTYVDKYGWRQCRACKRTFRGARPPHGWKATA